MNNVPSNTQQFVVTGVEICFTSITENIDRECRRKGETWAEVYKDLGFHKSFASRVKRGIIIPPHWQRVKIAKRLGVDSSEIWNFPIIQSADEMMKGEEQVADANAPSHSEKGEEET